MAPMYLLLLGALGQSTKLETDGLGGIAMTVTAGRNVSMRTVNFQGQVTSTSDLVTAAALASELRLATVNAVDTSTQNILNAMAEVRANISALSTAISNTEAARAAGATATAANISTLQTQVSQLVAIVPTSVSCQPYTLTSGTVTGHGTHPGAVAILTCNPGYSLGRAGAQSTVVCLASGQWSDGGNSQCTLDLTSPPTAAPTQTPPETVTCCMTNDDRFVAAYADGIRLTTRIGPGPRHLAFARIQFPSNTRVLGVHTSDGECGCLCGYWMMVCSTPSGTSQWDLVTPSAGLIQQDNRSFVREWTVKTISQRAASFQPSLINIGVQWTTAAYAPSLAANGFVTPTYEIPFGPYRSGNDPLQNRVPYFLGVLNNRDPTSVATTLSCPTPITGQINHYDNTQYAVGALCGGFIYRNSTRSRYDWYWRIQMS